MVEAAPGLSEGPRLRFWFSAVARLRETDFVAGDYFSTSSNKGGVIVMCLFLTNQSHRLYLDLDNPSSDITRRFLH